MSFSSVVSTSSPLQLASTITTSDGGKKRTQKVELFKKILKKVGEDDDPNEGLSLIDALQRLQLDYHFQSEIAQILHKSYVSDINGDYQLQLQQVALRFRLLRQHGYNVSADKLQELVANYKEGKCEMKLSEDIKGLVELYEASHLSVEGETILEEARILSENLLNELMKKQHNQVVKNTLEYPHHKTSSRFTSNTIFQTNYQGENGWIFLLQELAAMEFNFVKSLHQKELAQVFKWWEELGLARKLNFARNQPMKWYVWSMTCLMDPDLSEERLELTKIVSLVYVIDDIFDVHGTLDELTLFTETITTWDYSAADQLPEYLRICFKALDDTINQISLKVYQQHGYNPLYSLRKAWRNLCNAFLLEAKWFDSNHMPKAEEYLENGIISSGVHVGLVHIFFLLGHNLTHEFVDIIENHPKIISSTATILRLWDDLGTAKDENQDGKDGSYLDYYMRENEDVGIEEARNCVLKKICDAWKCLNNECLYPNMFSLSFGRACINIARMVPLMYSYDGVLDGFVKTLLF